MPNARKQLLIIKSPLSTNSPIQISILNKTFQKHISKIHTGYKSMETMGPKIHFRKWHKILFEKFAIVSL